jgi:hypothetical protein
MKTLLPFAACAVLLLSGCDSAASGPLSDSECREMAQREIDLAMSAMPDPDRAGVREMMEQANASSPQRCLAGESWQREDYQCAQAASTHAAFGECMRVVIERKD